MELAFPAKDVEAAKAALLKTPGLELIQEERPIQMLEVSQRIAPGKYVKSISQQEPRP